MTRFHCLKCGDPSPTFYVQAGAGEHFPSCGGRVIPIATPCHPPEPTVIDESDLAPGMVGVIKSEGSGMTWAVPACDVSVDHNGLIDGELADINVVGQILEIATVGKVRP